MKFKRAPVLHLLVGEGRLRAEAKRADLVTWAGEATYQTADDLAEAVARLGAAPAERCKRLQVTLQRPPAQTRALRDLPPVGERELASIVANQAGRFFRRNGAPLVTDAVWLSNGAGRVTHAAAVEEPLVAAIVSGAAQAGLLVESISPAGHAHLQLFPAAERAVRTRARRKSLLKLGVAALGVWMLAGGLFGARLVVERRDVDAELAAAEAPLAALRDVKQEMRTAESMVRTLTEARRDRGLALATLARVNGSLPDSTVLTSYMWRADGSGVVAGAGRRAADVLTAIDRSAAVADPRLEGAIVREPLAGHEWERFTIVFAPKTP